MCQETALGKGEFVERVIIPLRTDGLLFQTYKISKRFDQDISAVCGAFAVSLDGNEVASARIAYGGVAAVPTRAPAAEAAIAGQPWDEATIRAAMLELEKDFSPISDMRASAEYRMQVSQNLLLRFWMDCAGGGTRVYGYGR